MSRSDIAERCAEINQRIGEQFPLTATGAWPATRHLLDRPSAHAIIAALAAGRPLLVRGEPGIGKSQLARAAAALLERQFLPYVVQPDSEYQELLWAVDHTARLADAQLNQQDQVRQIRHYIGPGALWWALHWQGAAKQAEHCRHNYQPPEDHDAQQARKNGCVLLIDEIDKADIALANGLLEVLGNRRFGVPALGKTVPPSEADLPAPPSEADPPESPSAADPPQPPSAADPPQPPPLVVLTSNDTRQLPAALLRRCVVLKLVLPTDRDRLIACFIQRGETHFPHQALDQDVLARAAELIVDDRAQCAPTARTGLAEYLDLLYALSEVAADRDAQLVWLGRLGGYFGKSDGQDALQLCGDDA